MWSESKLTNNLTTDLYCLSGKMGAVQLCIQKPVYQTTSSQPCSCMALTDLVDTKPQEPTT